MTGRFSLAALAAFSFTATAAIAQDVPADTVPAQASEATVAQPVADPNVVFSELHGDWGVRCFRVESRVPCDVLQVGSNPDTQQRLMMISIAYLPADQAYAAQIIVPLGITLARGLDIEAGAATIPGLRFNRCENDGCYVEVALAAEAIDALANTTDPTMLTMFAYGQAEPQQIPFSVTGFGEAVARMREEALMRAVPGPQ